LISVANGFEVQCTHATIFITAVFPLCICFHLMVLLLCFLYRTHIMCCYLCSPVLQKSTDAFKCKEMPTRIILWTLTEARSNGRNTVTKVGQIKDTVTMMHYAEQQDSLHSTNKFGDVGTEYQFWNACSVVGSTF
jgi:hypothetical protein